MSICGYRRSRLCPAGLHGRQEILTAPKDRSLEAGIEIHATWSVSPPLGVTFQNTVCGAGSGSCFHSVTSSLGRRHVMVLVASSKFGFEICKKE